MSHGTFLEDCPRTSPRAIDPPELQEIRRNIYESLAQMASAFASPARLKIIQLLAQSDRSVEDVARETGESVANASQHLQRLLKAGLVICERHGVSRIYRISNPRVLALWEEFQNLGHELDRALDEKEEQLTDPNLRAPEPAQEILRRTARGDVILLDVREARESDATRVPGAIAIPLATLSDPDSFRSLRLPKSKTLFIYCRGRYCSLASQAVRILRREGYKAFRLRESAFRLRMIQGGVR